MLSQIDQIIDKLFASSPVLAGLIVMMWIQYKYLGTRDARDLAESERREKIWTDLANSNKLTAVAGQKLQERSIDVIQEAAAAFGRSTSDCEKMDAARQVFEREAGR